MKVLVTGAKGFIGKNLISELKNHKFTDIYEYDTQSSLTDLDEYTKDANFVFHLAGVNRTNNENEFLVGNFGFTTTLLESLKKNHNKCPIMISSSIQAELANPYGISKKAGEDLITNYGKEYGVKILIYRFPNVFGKWCRPNYNSVIATFSYNIANNLPIMVNDPDIVLNLVYIDDLVKELINSMNGLENRIGDFCYVEPVYSVRLGDIVDLIYSFKNSRYDLSIPNQGDLFIKKLYANYISYLPETQLIYNLKMNMDERGSFTEFLKTPDRGQVSINVTKPGIVKGNHWHHTKNEKFLVVSGSGLIRLRKIGETNIIEYLVSGDRLQVIDIPPGYTHNIANLGNTDLVTVMWVNESFNKDLPDTIYMEV
ncbi:MAG TPA: capsular polysaccharide biosynthesis protein CapF [Bacilli bacterium]|nr:capsular polysaccharide biosynthesis protein CapF [Bacilli bacterium]